MIEAPPVLPVSLIITVLNEAKSLPRFLGSLEKQTVHPAEFIVCDGGSTDATVPMLEQWRSNSTIRTNIIVAPGAGISAGRNRAIEATSNDLIAVTDAGTTLDPTWLQEISRPLLEGADVASGFFRASGTGKMDRIIACIITPTIHEIIPEKFLPSSRSLGIRKLAWQKVGGYPEWLDYCEDLVFDLALKTAGSTFVFNPKAQVTWSARPDLVAFARQYYRYARGDGKANLWAKRHAIRYTSYLAGSLLLAASRSQPRWRAILGALGILYMWKYWTRIARSRESLRYLILIAVPATPIVAVIGDIAKMLGYPVGIIHRWRSK